MYDWCVSVCHSPLFRFFRRGGVCHGVDHSEVVAIVIGVCDASLWVKTGTSYTLQV